MYIIVHIILDLLRKYEQKVVVEDPTKRLMVKETVAHAEDKIVFDVKASLPDSSHSSASLSSSSSSSSSSSIVPSRAVSSSHPTTATTTNMTTHSDDSTTSSSSSPIVDYKTSSKITLKDDFDCSTLAATLVGDFGFSSSTVEAQLPTLLMGPGRVLHVGLNMLKDELTFAEDLVLVQCMHR